MQTLTRVEVCRCEVSEWDCSMVGTYHRPADDDPPQLFTYRDRALKAISPHLVWWYRIKAVPRPFPVAGLGRAERDAEQFQRQIAALESAFRTHPGAAALRDADRLIWLMEVATAVDMVADPDNLVTIWWGTDPAISAQGRTLRETIDAAMKEPSRG